MQWYSRLRDLYEAKRYLGIRVDRASATLPQTAHSPLFTVSGGRVRINQIIGEVTVVMGAVANNTKLTAITTVGADVDLCAVVDTANDAVGLKWGITGTLATAMVHLNILLAQATPIIVPAGTIDLDCAANNTGEAKWSIFYSPIDDGAVVTAA